MTINASPVALLVHAHSEADSFVTAMRDRIAATLSGSGYEITNSDLYGMNWNPVLSPSDFGTRKDKITLTSARQQGTKDAAGHLEKAYKGETEKGKKGEEGKR